MHSPAEGTTVRSGSLVLRHRKPPPRCERPRPQGLRTTRSGIRVRVPISGHNPRLSPVARPAARSGRPLWGQGDRGACPRSGPGAIFGTGDFLRACFLEEWSPPYAAFRPVQRRTAASAPSVAMNHALGAPPPPPPVDAARVTLLEPVGTA